MMKLSEFIVQKQNELSRTYKDVIFKSATDVFLGKNMIQDNLRDVKTNTETLVEEVISFSELSGTPTMPYTPNGTKVIFEVKPKGKRKYINKDFYVLWM